MARIKGVNLVPLVKILRGIDAAAQARLPANLKRYLHERILISSWYPEEDALGLMRIAVGLAPKRGNDAWVQLGRFAAVAQAKETYRGLVEERGPADVMRKAHVLWRSHHDTGELSTEIADLTRVRITLRGYDGLVAETCQITTGFLIGIVEAAGARNVLCRVESCDLTAKAASWELTWEPETP